MGIIIIFLYGLVILWGIIIPFFVLIYAVFQIQAEFKGAPYVPTSDKLLMDILNQSHLKKGDKFLELGSGDGRVTRMAVKKFGVYGVGIDINPMLTIYAKYLARKEKIKNIQFKKGDLFNVDV